MVSQPLTSETLWWVGIIAEPRMAHLATSRPLRAALGPATQRLTNAGHVASSQQLVDPPLLVTTPAGSCIVLLQLHTCTPGICLWYCKEWKLRRRSLLYRMYSGKGACVFLKENYSGSSQCGSLLPCSVLHIMSLWSQDDAGGSQWSSGFRLLPTGKVLQTSWLVTLSTLPMLTLPTPLQVLMER